MSTTRKIKADYIDGVFTQLNYVDTSTANDKITLWNRFLDTAASRPEDGTGGSPSANVTWTRTTSDPIQGEGSFLYSKLNSVNTRGEGVSRDITIPSGQKARMQSIRFDYRIASGTYSGGSSSTDSDLIIYMYRTTATGRLIEPSVIKLDGAVVGVNYSYQSEFQADSDATGYRLIIFSATTSTSNFTVQFDNFYVGPSTNVTGAITTEWQSYTPTLTGLTNGLAYTNATNTGFWRRVGDSVELDIRTSFTGAPGTGTGAFQWAIPSGLVVNTSKITAASSLKVIGSATYTDAGTNFSIAQATYMSTTTIGALSTAAADNFTTTIPITWASSDSINLRALVPIVGWGATATLGQDADTRVVSATAQRTTNQTITAGSATTIAFQTALSDRSGILNTSTGVVTIPVAGTYQIKFSGRFDTGGTGPSQVRVTVLKTATSYTLYDFAPLSSSTSYPSSGSIDLDCIAGDTIAIQINATGQNITVIANEYFMSVSRIPGPSQIAASDFIGVGLRKSATQTYTANASFQNVTFLSTSSGSLGFDTNGSWNGTDTFTAPAAGKYEVSCSLAVNSTNVANADYELSFLGGGSSQFVDLVRTGATGVPLNLQGTATFNLIAGQTITIRFITTANHSVNNLTINTNTNASIKRIG